MTHATFLSDIGATTPAAQFGLALLDRYEGGTKELYDRHLGAFFVWCVDNMIDPFFVTRAQLERYCRELLKQGKTVSSVLSTISPVKTFYKLANADGVIPRNPAAFMWLPKKQRPDATRRVYLDRHELARWLHAAKNISSRHWATGVLTGVMALRASEVASLKVKDCLESVDGHRVLRFSGKGNKPATLPLTVPAMRALDAAIGRRATGPLILARDGKSPITRHGVATLIDTITRNSGIDKPLHPHALRASAITAALDSGIPLRDVQHFARHEDPATTILYDRNPNSLDRSAVHSLSAWLAP